MTKRGSIRFIELPDAMQRIVEQRSARNICGIPSSQSSSRAPVPKRRRALQRVCQHDPQARGSKVLRCRWKLRTGSRESVVGAGRPKVGCKLRNDPSAFMGIPVGVGGSIGSRRTEIRCKGLREQMKTPPAMQALVDIAKLDPQPGQQGFIDCPKCGKRTFGWYKEAVIGKLSGNCTGCGLKLPRA